MVWCLKPKKDTSIGPRMRVMERKRTVLEKLRWQESNKPFWKEQCRNYISALVLKTFPQAKRNNFWGCQCLVEDSNSSLRTLKSHHKLYFSLSLCSQPKACPPQKLKPKYSQVLQTHSHGHISLLRTHLPTHLNTPEWHPWAPEHTLTICLLQVSGTRMWQRLWTNSLQLIHL